MADVVHSEDHADKEYLYKQEKFSSRSLRLVVLLVVVYSKKTIIYL